MTGAADLAHALFAVIVVALSCVVAVCGIGLRGE